MNQKRVTTIFLVSLCVLGTLLASSAKAALPAGFEFETVASGLDIPVGIAITQDGRIFIAQKTGAVRLVKNGQLLVNPVIQLTDVNTYGDKGLIGIAVDPNFSTNGYLYLSYTYENTPGSNYSGRKTARVARVTVVGDVASEASKLVLIGTVGGNITTPSCDDYPLGTDCIPSDSSSHSAGGLRFGPDGKLYATFGDGASFDVIDPRSERAQNLDSLAGKMVRINPDGTAPTDNPFYDGNPNSNKSKIYAYGLRNMFRFNFRPSTGGLYGGDVGWDTWEEINLITPGANFGWPCREGNFQAQGQTCTAVNYVNPMYTYVHDPVQGGSITLGAFPGNGAYPAQYNNTMIFGDYVLNWMKMLNLNAADTMIDVTDFALPADAPNGPVEFFTGPEGRIYLISIYTGELRRINYTLGNRQPVAQISAAPTSGLNPLMVNFSSAGSSDPDNNPLTFAWNFGDGGTDIVANPQHTYTTSGTYLASITVFDGQGGQNAKNITINAGNQAPTPVITAPTAGDVYFPGEILSATGSATDPENGNLAPNQLTWKAIIHHNTHTHLLEEHTGTSFQMPAPDHGDPDVYLEIELTATDNQGLSAKTSVNLYLNNNVSPDGNWIQNRSLEEVDPLNSALPNHWTKGGWGSNTRTLTYPVAGQSGAKAAQVTVTNYTSGDAKWIFDPATVKAGNDFVFSDYYKATVPTRIVAEVAYVDGSFTYHDLAVLPIAANWTQTNAAFTTPIGAKRLTIFHVIESNGTLTVDNYSLMLASAVPPPPPPPSNLILNPSLETANGAVPQNWASNKWGTSTATFTYPVAGQDGTKAAKVVVSGYSSGDAKWYFNDVTVTSGTTYTFSNYYQSTVPTELVARFKSTTGTFTYLSLGAVPTSATWVQVTKSILIPANVNGLTVFHIITANGSLTVDNYSLTLPVVVPPGTNLIVNGFMETANGNSPTNWTPVTLGPITPTFTYPVIGVDGGKGASIAITNMAPGADANARWQFDEVPITTGTEYTYEAYYKASTISDIIGRYTFNDNSEHFFGLKKEIVAAANWTFITGKFVGPVNIKSINLMHLISTNATFSIDNAKLYVSGTGTPNEIIDPVTNFINPLNGQTVSGTITLTANATDNVGIAGLFFAVDGTPLSAEMTSPPWTQQWNSATVADGTHSLKVTVRDAVGNNSREVITVTVNNSTPPPPPGNLILNPSVETANGTAPQDWSTGGWGTNTKTFTYPVTGQDGAKAVRVVVSGYSSGDAKWYFKEVAVTPGTTYTFSDYYISTITSRLMAQFKSITGTFTYLDLGTVPTTATFTQVTKSILIPANTATLTIFHMLQGNGTLTTDNFSLTAPTGGDTTKPTVSVTAPVSGATVSGASVVVSANASDNIGVVGVQFKLDGVNLGAEDTTVPYSIVWNTTTATNAAHTITAVARDAAGNNNTSTGIPVTVNNVVVPPTNLVLNPSLETAQGSLPQNWSDDNWGTNTPVFTYPVTGTDGAKAAKVQITAYTNGDAKWAFDHVNIVNGKTYTWSDKYQSNVVTSVVVEYLSNSNVYTYQTLGTVPVSAVWGTAQFNVTPPANTKSMTVYHLLDKVGSLTTDLASVVQQ